MVAAPKWLVNQLNHNVKIANDDGTGTAEFIQQWNLLQQLVRQVTSDASAIAILQALNIDTTAPIDGGGNLLALAPISHDVSGVTPGSYTNTNLTVDEFGHITAAADGSAGSGGFFAGATGSFSGTRSGTAFATKGIVFKPDSAITVTHITAWIDANATTDQYLAQISSLSGVTLGSPDAQNITAATVDTILGTSAAVTIGSTDMRAVRFALPTPVTLTPGTYYLISTTFSNGALGTSICGVATNPTGSGVGYALNAPATSYVGQCQFATLTLAAGNTATIVAGAYVQMSIEGSA